MPYFHRFKKSFLIEIIRIRPIARKPVAKPVDGFAVPPDKIA
jgi:hypothetical protein